MKLLTKEVIKKATKQYTKGSDMDEQMVVAKFFDAWGDWKWYLMNMKDETGDYAWGIVKGFDVEIGSFSLTELKQVLGLRLERDMYFEPMKASDVFNKLNKGEHV
tara:strand:+ start:259 stop:573 length:315 start_codon:yes stop_codon:yes gene_type:complete